MGPEERKEFYRALARVVQGLPARQQLVARTYFRYSEHFKPRDTFQLLASLVSAETGQEENPQTIKSLWHAAKKTISEGMTQQGYNPGGGTAQ
jgi:hypothetical protein